MNEFAERMDKLETVLLEEFAVEFNEELNRLFPIPQKRRGRGRPKDILRQFDIATFMLERRFTGESRKHINSQAMARFGVGESMLFKSRGYSRLRAVYEKHLKRVEEVGKIISTLTDRRIQELKRQEAERAGQEERLPYLLE